MLLANRAYVVKKQGIIANGSSSSAPFSGQVTWSKFGGPSEAWEVTKEKANFI